MDREWNMLRDNGRHDLPILRRIAENTALREGEEGVRRILREIYRSKRIGTKELAVLTLIPVPTVAAVRKELEKAGLITRAKEGASLTTLGEKFAEDQLGLTRQHRLVCPTCMGRTIQIPEAFAPILGTLRKRLPSRPEPLTRLDQAHGTSETALRRALYMLEKGDVEGRDILFLGDDDCTSIATGLLRVAHRISVADVDARLLHVIQRISHEEHLDVECLEHDLRAPLPAKWHRQYDVVFTDPPYTNPGLVLFLSRGLTALKPREGASLYLAYAHQPPKGMLIVQKTLTAMGLAQQELLPRFNVYEGAEMLANTTFLSQLETTAHSRPLITGVFRGKLYTGEITQTVRVYQCRCGERQRVGAAEPYSTIEALKATGCPKCGEREGFVLQSRVKLKETLGSRLVFRSYQPGDFPAVLEFEREIARLSFPDAPMLDAAFHRQKLERAAESASDGLRVAVLGDEIVGWLWLKVEKDRTTGERFGYVKSIIVKLTHRHQGFGARLIKVAEEYFRGKGVRRVDLIVGADNYAACLFFEELGYEREHSTMRKVLDRGAEER